MFDKENWKELGLTQKEYAPQHVRLKHRYGTVYTSSEILADHFEEDKWGKAIAPEAGEEYKSEKHYRNNLLFDDMAAIDARDYRTEEPNDVPKRQSGRKHHFQTISRWTS